MRRIWLAGCLFLGACASNGGNDQKFDNVQSVIHQVYSYSASKKFSEPDRSKLIDCVTWATVKDIPAADQSRILAVFNGGPIDPETDKLFVKWLGFSWSGYRNAKDVSPEFKERVTQAYFETCPDLAQKYPNFVGVEK